MQELLLQEQAAAAYVVNGLCASYKAAAAYVVNGLCASYKWHLHNIGACEACLMCYGIPSSYKGRDWSHHHDLRYACSIWA